MSQDTKIPDTLPQPEIVTRDEWLVRRKELLTREKELTKQQDQISAARRRLPMVRIDKEYTFDGPDGSQTLAELFDGKRQLIVYHFMFGPDWKEGCPGCTGFVDALGDLSPLAKRDARFVLVSRAPRAKLEAYQAAHGWTVPWYSSGDGDFNYDFHVSFDEARAPVEYNYKDAAQLQRERGNDDPIMSDLPGLSVFLRTDNGVFHTYSTFARGVELLTDTSPLLDVTPYGRQEDWEDSPAGWPQHPTYG